MNADEVRRIHDLLGHSYLAYAYPEHPAIYPMGARRTAAAVQLVRERVANAGEPARVVDIGCGRGDLCFELATAGWTAVGVDFSSAMIADAEAHRGQIAPDVRARVTFHHRDAFKSDLPPGAFDAVTALGVLETEEDDGRLFREAHRLLRVGGTMVVTGRNRLFNLVSLNQHTGREIASGEASDLLIEIDALLERTAENDFRLAFDAFAAALRDMPAAGLTPGAVEDPTPEAPFRLATRQHTPLALERSAARHGFGQPVHVGLHPHLLPPRFEALAPESYNALAKAADVFARLPIALVWSSAFASSFVKQ